MTKKRKHLPQPITSADVPLPQTVEEAVAFLQRISAPDVITTVKDTPFNDLIRLQRDIGMQVRNHLGLWGRNRALIACLPLHVRWPDNAALYIMEAWWQRLHDG